MNRWPEQGLELAPQNHVDFRHWRLPSEVGKAGHREALIADPAWHNAGKMRQVRVDVERNAVQRHPLLHADTDSGNLVLAPFTLFGPPNPDPNSVVAPLAAHIECGKRADAPLLERGNEPADVLGASFEIEHYVSDALARPVIGHLPPAAGLVEREPGVDDVA